MLNAKYVLLIAVLFSIVGLYLFRLHSTRPIFKDGDRVRISSSVSEDPSIEGYQQKITLEGVKIYIDRFPEYSYGDYISVEGEVAKGKGGYFLKSPRVIEVREVGGFGVVREKILNAYLENLPEPHNGLLSGIVLGTKNSLEKGFLEKLRGTGTLHIVVASGTNISIFAGGLLYLLISTFKTHRKLAVIVSLIFIWVYIFFIGFQPPIVRAGIMASIAFAAQILGREGEGIRALIFSAVVMVLSVPQWIFDLGFQLSFLATAGIILMGSRIAERLGGFGRLGRFGEGIRETLAMTLAAQVAVLPLIYYKFGSFPLLSPLVNVLVVPIVPLIMAGGFILGLLGLFGVFGKIFSWFIWLPLEYFVQVINIFS